MRRRTLPVVAAVGVLALTACTAAGEDASRDEPGEELVRVVASFYPLQFVAEQVAGERAAVQNLTPAGAEPHDLELSPVDVLDLEDADLVLTLSGFQPALDDALAEVSGPVVLNTAEEAEHEHPEPDDSADDGHTDEEHSEDEHSDDEHDHAGGDPHFWLDPTRLAHVADEVAEALTELDPDSADTYRTNADALTTQLSTLDTEFTTSLTGCEQDVIVVSHEAFGYLADRYGLTQVGLAGIDPDAEPSPARLQEIRDVVEDEDVGTIFTESLVNPDVAEALAAELGIDVAMLDPLEGLSDPSGDYLSVMRQNLQTLRESLGCA
ncbi:zinc ABC transporter substrate-binding protein [Ruania alkalisoli]|uniref:Zinc ABC transporter substrate-binding protein n=1 Tax=Ruania alkalisoli TaxID=2779775 RepID=A0A7M1SP61_9MICO|nr:metal ABC transporter substrate-binding protein [Ruania alkalisoli]QOR69221.1 zinc ABC transporter substrate-binding protein [Ruania alkalisoli]